MKWINILLLLCFIMVCVMLYIIRQKDQKISRLETINLHKQVDTLTIETTKNVVKYRNRTAHNTKIVEKWNSIHDTVFKKDTLLLEAKNDINYLDTSLKKCDSALNSYLALSSTQEQLIKAMRGKKTPLILPYIGIGISMGYSLKIEPSFQTGIGLNLNTLFGNN